MKTMLSILIFAALLASGFPGHAAGGKKNGAPPKKNAKSKTAAKPTPAKSETSSRISSDSLAKPGNQPSAAEIAKIAGKLGAAPVSFGPRINDRAAWDKIAATETGKAVIKNGERVLSTPMPEKTPDIYLIYSTRGSRRESDRIDGQRRGRIPALVEAECLENKGRFIPELEKSIRAIAAEPTWVGTAHDGSLTNYKKTLVTIDLYSSALGWTLATTDWLLGDKLSPGVRALIRSELQWRIFDPFHKMVEGKQSLYWLTHTHNWNSVCLAGVTGAALGVIDSREERAYFVAAAMKYSEYFLKGFTGDGYCGEGTGYWNYGFGHYVLLSEIIRLATADGIDLLARPNVLAPAIFGPRFEVVHGIYPAFADTSPGGKPDAQIVAFLNERFKLGLDVQPGRNEIGGGLIFEDMMYAFPVPYDHKVSASAPKVEVGLRSWFDAARILICRPSSTSRLGAAIIGNDNGVNHNHNDVGSFIVVSGDKVVIADPGSEAYTKRTFSAQRYVSNVLNSYGHCCPVVAGKLQEAGAKAHAETLSTEFTDSRDTLEFDIRSAYDVPTLQTLTRKYVFSREGAGSLAVSDTVAFGKPETFEEALITFGECKILGANHLLVSDGGESLDVTIEAGGETVEIKTEQIKEDIHGRTLPTRIGIRLAKPVAQARVTMTIQAENR